MIKWLKRMLGITASQEYLYMMQDEIEELNTKVYESISLLGECLVELNTIKESNAALSDLINKRATQVKDKIKAIPKEVVVKNVLSI